ncbi:DUF4129 domain-containing protein [Arthrobacter psychrolactophilus]
MALPLTLLTSLPGWLPGDVPLVPDADEARRWAQEELAHKVYQDAKPGLAEQIAALVRSAIDEFLNNVGSPSGNFALAIAIGALLLAIVAIVFIIRPRLNRTVAATKDVFAGEPLLSAEQHRALARAAAASQDFHTAISEQFRAMVRAAEERDVSLPALGRTALEIAVELQRAFPAQGHSLLNSAEIFNAVRYGHLTASAAMYEELVLTDRAVATSKPLYADDSAAAVAVPS